MQSQLKLARVKRDQKAAFYSLRNNLREIYDHLKQHDISRFTTSFWENQNAKLERALLPYPPFSFLEDAVISFTMFMTAGGKWLREEVAFLERTIPGKRLYRLLEEDYVGDPLLLNSRYLTSHNSIHHLYHLVRFAERTRCDLDGVDTVLEWGGGYGNMAKILRRLKSTPFTYVIIDTPILCCLQWLYLSAIFGGGEINLIQRREEEIRPGKINLIPVCFVDCYEVIPDLFISTWALSESSKYSLDYVVGRKWLSARHLLLAYCVNSLKDAGRLVEVIEGEGLVVEDIEFLPGQRYAFR